MALQDSFKTCFVALATCCTFAGGGSAALAQTLNAYFNLAGDDGTPFPEILVHASSTYTFDGSVYTVTDRLEVDVTMIDPQVDNLRVDALFRWDSFHLGTMMVFPKTWEDAIFWRRDLNENVVFDDAEATWQTTGPVVASPGIVFIDGTWRGTYYLDNCIPATYCNTPGFQEANATTWAMGGLPLNTALSNDSLSAAFGVNDRRVALDSTVAETSNGFIYTYTLTNQTGAEVHVDWEPAALNVTLAAGETYVHTLHSRHRGVEARGYAGLTRPANTAAGEAQATRMIANAIVPNLAQPADPPQVKGPRRGYVR